MTAPDQNPVAQPANDNSKPKASLYNSQTELQRLQNDLKYMTGKGDKLEVEEQIKELREKISKLPESDIISSELHKNFEPSMSFTPSQLNAMENLKKELDGRFNSGDINFAQSDLKLKQRFDMSIEKYKNLVDEGKFSDDDGLDKVILNYEKAFGISEAPSDNETKKETRKLERARQEDIGFVKGKMDYLKTLENRLLEEQASAKVSILGRKDVSKTELTEKEISQVKRDIALGVVMAASNYLGFNVDQSDLGL